MVGNGLELSIVVPVYMEERNIGPFLQRLVPTVEEITTNYEVIFCLDPCPDRTLETIISFSEINPRIKLLHFSRRFGQPAATIAGLTFARGDRVGVIDVDLQDPPELFKDFYSKMNDGYDVVYGTRNSRSGESILKKIIAHLGYRVINRLSDVKIPRNTGDFRMMSRRVVDEVVSLNESHGFLRGLVALVGYKQTGVTYDRDPRFQGKGNYNKYLGSLKIGLNGLIGFSSRPLTVMAVSGGVLSVCSFLIGIFYAAARILGNSEVPGLPTTVILISFFSGVQLLSLGLVGEYVSRIYDEVKRRPKFIVQQKVGLDD
jgi:glycosyltransferase involved in cell wall biosynthesis